MTTGELILYDAMVSAIVACHRTDEVKAIHDKALALESYARMAKDAASERRAREIRIRAERRAGELLAAIPRQRGDRAMRKSAPAGPIKQSVYEQELARVGISRSTATKYAKLATVPADEFERALAQPDASSRMVRAHAPKPEPKPEPKPVEPQPRPNPQPKHGPKLSDAAYEQARAHFINSVVNHCLPAVRKAADKLIGAGELETLRKAIDDVLVFYIERAQRHRAPKLSVVGRP
jgi:hypothetical protein